MALSTLDNWRIHGADFIPRGKTFFDVQEDFYELLNQLCMLEKLSGNPPCVQWLSLRGAAIRKEIIVNVRHANYEYPLLWSRFRLINEGRLYRVSGVTSTFYTSDKWKGHFSNTSLA